MVVANYSVRFHKTALKQIPNLKAAKLDSKAKALVEILKNDPYQTPPPYEKLCTNLAGKFSRRINIQHRLVYQVNESTKTVDILSMWSHYETL